MGAYELRDRLAAVEREVAIIKDRVSYLCTMIRNYGLIIVLAACFGTRALDVLTKWLEK